jgi:hypothetical protein
VTDMTQKEDACPRLSDVDALIGQLETEFAIVTESIYATPPSHGEDCTMGCTRTCARICTGL